MPTAMQYFIMGRVQGVWFRDSTRHQAEQLGLNGYARNLPDGSVEVVASGSNTALSALEKWLWEGPPLAQVHQVKKQACLIQPAAGFTIG
jgi:acylphosphatase